MVAYTLLVNHLFAEVAKHPHFQEWQSKGTLPRQPIEKLIEEFTVNHPSPLPSRFCKSAVLMAQYVYKSWFKLQKKRRLRLQGKKRWVEAIESDYELAQTTSFSQEEICSRAQVILNLASCKGTNISKSNRSSRKPKSGSTLLGFLLDRFDATDNPLERRAIVHLLNPPLSLWEYENSVGILYSYTN
jgi:hypothetical protein